MNLFRCRDLGEVSRELARRRKQTKALDVSLPFKKTRIVGHKAKVITLPGKYKGGLEIRKMYLEMIRKNEKFFNEFKY